MVSELRMWHVKDESGDVVTVRAHEMLIIDVNNLETLIFNGPENEEVARFKAWTYYVECV